MRKLLLLALAIIVSVVVFATIDRRTRRIKVIADVSKVEKDLREHLNVGASRAAVESYLDKRGIQHSYVDQSTPVTEYARTESALIRESSRSWLVRGDIQILFKFEDQDKLIRYSVKEIFTGP